MPALGRISLTTRCFPGRVRLPYGEDPQADYNLSLFNLEAMFASHEVSARPKPDEFRVVLIGRFLHLGVPASAGGDAGFAHHA